MTASRTDTFVSLPRPLTSLIGRAQELTHLDDLLRSDVALVTITGFGGIGKTRLALQAALELEPLFDAGAVFVPLAAVTQASSMPRAIALTAGLDESVDTVRALAEAWGSWSRLLVLDNLEQIPDAADMAITILQEMPQVTILATSRSRLDIAGEYVLPLEPLDTGDAAVQLFIERAKAVAPGLPTDATSVAIITEICRKLDGIPLAIELAAARLAIFSLTDLRDQLAHQLPVLASKRVDLPDRQKTMRNAIAWTYELLTTAERRLFSWLSVYEQDVSLESIRHVGHQLELTDDPLDLVQFLVSRSLLRSSRIVSTSPRYQMLQMLREFGHEQLLATNEDHLARRSHAMDMVDLAERAEPHLRSSETGYWLKHLGNEVPNLLHAMAWSRDNNLPEVPLRIIGNIWGFIEKMGFANHFLDQVPEITDDVGSAQTRANALVGIGNLHESISETDVAEEQFRRALALSQNLPDQRAHVESLNGLAEIYLANNDLEPAERYSCQAQEIATQTGYERGQVTSSSQLARIMIMTGNTAEAIPVLKEMIAAANCRGDIASEAAFSSNLGVALQIEDRYAEAEPYFVRSVTLAESSGNLASATVGYVNLSGASLIQNDLEQAKAYGEKGLQLARRAGLISSEVSLLNNIHVVYQQEKDFGTAAQGFAHAVNLINNESGVAQHVQFAGVYASMCLEIGMRSEAAEMLGAVRSMRKSLNLIAHPWQAEGEAEDYANLDPEHNPDIAEDMERGARLDRKGLVQRMNEITDMIVLKYPPGNTAVEMIHSNFRLTPRETEVLDMLAKGLTNAEIAEELFLSTRTVTTHLTNIFSKLEVNNRSRAIAVAMDAGLL